MLVSGRILIFLSDGEFVDLGEIWNVSDASIALLLASSEFLAIYSLTIIMFRLIRSRLACSSASRRSFSFLFMMERGS